MSTTLFCWGCAGVGDVHRVTPGLRCACGSKDVDLWENSDEQRGRVAALASLSDPGNFTEYMTKTSADLVGTEIPGWAQYAGPGPGPNPMHHGFPPGDKVCEECKGSGIDIKDGGPCRACGADGKRTPPTSVSPPPAVARHGYPSTQTKVPFIGRRVQGGRKSSDPLGSPEEHIRATTPDWSPVSTISPPPKGADHPLSWEHPDTHYPRADSYSPMVKQWKPMQYQHENKKSFEMHGASCPSCGIDPTHLVKDHKEDAHWYCRNCGPLANIDANPEVDPYKPPEDFTPMDRKKFKMAKRLFKGKKTGVLMEGIALVAQHNPGLTAREVVSLARDSAQRYAEDR